ncbi:MAG: hypothetical protein ABIT96_07770 [Ferruginibacter sp.]
MQLKNTISALGLLFICATGYHCGSNSVKDGDIVKDSIAVPGIKTDTQMVEGATVRPPIINITDSLIKKEWVIYVKDSAATVTRLNEKLAEIYKNTLPNAAGAAGIVITSAPMAWYKSQGLPYFFEAGYMVDKKPSKTLPKKVLLKFIGGDSAVVAHFYGPNELIATGYEVLNNWVKDNKKKISGKPYEIYVSDPFIENDDKQNPYSVRTDIFLPHK